MTAEDIRLPTDEERDASGSSGDQTPRRKHRHVSPWVQVLTGVALVGVLAVIPFQVSSYWTRVLTMVLMLAILSQAWNVVTGFVGYPAFGNVAFFGAGAYTVGILTARMDVAVPLALAAAGLVATLCCVVLGSPLMRVRGHYFAIATIGLAAAFREATYLIPWLTTSAAGAVIVPGFVGGRFTHETSAYLWMLGTLALTVLAAVYVNRSRFGYGLKAIRSDETVAATFGISTLRFKVQAWALSAVFFGLAGGIWAAWIGVIEPAGAYDLGLAVLYSVIALLGGLGTVAGPLIGAVLIGVLGEVIWAEFSGLHLLVMGVVIMVATLLLPEGIAGIWRGETSLRARVRDIREGRL